MVLKTIIKCLHLENIFKIQSFVCKIVDYVHHHYTVKCKPFINVCDFFFLWNVMSRKSITSHILLIYLLPFQELKHFAEHNRMELRQGEHYLYMDGL